MSTEKQVKQLVINKMTKAQYEAITPSEDELYLVDEEPASTTNLGPVKVDGTTITATSDGTISAVAGTTAWGDITGTLASQTDLQNALDAKANQSTTYTKTEVENALAGKAGIDKFVAGENITIKAGIFDITWTGTTYSGSADEVAQGEAIPNAPQRGATSGYHFFFSVPGILGEKREGSYYKLYPIKAGTVVVKFGMYESSAEEITFVVERSESYDDTIEISAKDTTYNVFTSFTDGLVPAAVSSVRNTFLGVSGWAIPSTFRLEASGFVPAPTSADAGKFLKGDGTWATVESGAAWGDITGTLADQTDLKDALDAKANQSTTYTKTEVDTAISAKPTIQVTNVDPGEGVEIAENTFIAVY